MSAATFTASTNLYEVLGIKKDATQEEVRKAYRRRALQTHPDRLPQDVNPADKKAAEEQFRLVNNAYEVLNNEDNRKLYDKYNVWPPPTETPDYGRSTRQGQGPSDPFFDDPFFRSPFGGSSRSRGFAFTDPFELFNSLFGDLHRAFESDPFFSNTPFFRSPFDDPFFRSPFDDPFFRSPFGSSPFGGSLLGPSPFGALMGGSMFPQLEGGSSRMYSSRTEAVGRNGQWVSRSQMTRTVNGRREVITKMIDANGNEHVTYSSPDGERYTINGIEQPAQSNRHIEGSRRSDTAPPPRQPPQAIADAPVQPAGHYIAPREPQAYSVPISGPAQTQAPPANAYVDRAHSHRSRHSSHRDRPTADDTPRRSHTSRESSAHSRPPADPRVAGHTRADSASSLPRGTSNPTHSHTPSATPAERIYGGHDPAAAAATGNGTYGAGVNGSAYAGRDPRRDSVQSHQSHHSHHSGKLHRDRSSRRDSRDYTRDRERAAPVPPEHAQRGWRGWFSSVLHPFRHLHLGHHHHHHQEEKGPQTVPPAH